MNVRYYKQIPAPCDGCHQEHACATQRLACLPYVQWLQGFIPDPQFARVPTRGHYEALKTSVA